MKKIIGLLCITVTIFCAQTFVVPKQESIKKESRSRLKNRVGNLLYEALEGSTNVLHSLSQVQKVTLEWLSEFIAGDKKNVLDSATDAELKALADQLEDMVKQYALLQTKTSALVSCISKK